MALMKAQVPSPPTTETPTKINRVIKVMSIYQSMTQAPTFGQSVYSTIGDMEKHHLEYSDRNECKHNFFSTLQKFKKRVPLKILVHNPTRGFKISAMRARQHVVLERRARMNMVMNLSLAP